MAKRNLGEKIKLTSYDDMFGLDTFSPGDQKLDGQIINMEHPHSAESFARCRRNICIRSWSSCYACICGAKCNASYRYCSLYCKYDNVYCNAVGNR